MKIENDRLKTKVSQLENQNRIIMSRFSRVPVNKYPEALKILVQKFKLLVPAFGKKKIAAFFLRAGLNLSTASISRFLKDLPAKPPGPVDDDAVEEEKVRKVTSRHPNHTFMIDLTAIPINGGFWVSWLPESIRQSWPFCWWLAIVIDHFSRKVIGFSIYYKEPKSEAVISLLNRIIRKLGKKPKYIISDKGPQFYPPKNAEDKENHPFRKWCRSKNIKPRNGAVGQHGSIAIIERFMRTIKTECVRKLILVPYDIEQLREELNLYITWYNQFRPHEYLKARTPQEVYANSPPLKVLDFEPNSDLPEFKLHISYLEGALLNGFVFQYLWNS